MHSVFRRLGQPVKRQIARRDLFQLDATPICGFAQSSSPMPTARSMPRDPVASKPSVTTRDRGLMSTPLPAAGSICSLVGLSAVMAVNLQPGPGLPRPNRRALRFELFHENATPWRTAALCAGVRRHVGGSEMHRILGTIGAMLAIVAVMAVLALPALALVGYDLFGGYDRGGYEFSALFGNDLFGGYERGGYEFSALFGNDLSGSYERGGYQLALAGNDLSGYYERGGYEFS